MQAIRRSGITLIGDSPELHQAFAEAIEELKAGTPKAGYRFMTMCEALLAERAYDAEQAAYVPFWEDPEINALRHQIRSEFFQRLQQTLIREAVEARSQESLRQMAAQPRLWVLARAALRIEQVGFWLFGAIGRRLKSKRVS